MERLIAPIQPKNRFHLDPAFLDRFRGQQPAWGPCGFAVYKRTYAQWLPELGRSEEFWETCKRVTEGTFSYLRQQIRSTGQRWDKQRAQRKGQEFFERMWQFRWLPPGRGLQFMGTKALEVKGSAVLQNCGFQSTQDIDDDFARPFAHIMDFLMLGVGIGFDVRGASKMTPRRPAGSSETFVVPDSREGWVKALRILLEAYAGKRPLPVYDFSQIRPAGTRLKTFGGTASGSGPLEELLIGVQKLLDANVCRPISSTTLLSIVTMVGRCVVAGNIRRSATLALGDATDADFIAAKDPALLNALIAQQEEAMAENLEWRRTGHDIGLLQMERDEHSALAPEFAWIQDQIDALQARRRVLEEQDPRWVSLEAQISAHPLRTHLWAANNSVICSGPQDYGKLAHQTVQNGEPGYLWIDVARGYGRLADGPNDDDAQIMGVNPCGEQGLFDRELCCLVETFPTLAEGFPRKEGFEDYKRTLKCAFLYAKVVTTIPTHNPETNAVISRNRRIGLSMAGIFSMVEQLGLNLAIGWWDACYKHVRALDKEYSGWMGIPRSIKVTSVKPGGTVPMLPGVEGGMKIPNARHYMRTVRMSNDSPIVQACRKAGYRVESDRYSPNTQVMYFPVEDKTCKRTAKQVSLWEQAATFTALQRWWSDNLVSATLTFQPHETLDVRRVIEAHEGQWKGCSFLPLFEHSYAQAPYIPCTEEEYLAAAAKLSPLVLDDATHEANEAFCDGGVCELKSNPIPKAA